MALVLLGACNRQSAEPPVAEPPDATPPIAEPPERETPAIEGIDIRAVVAAGFDALNFTVAEPTLQFEANDVSWDAPSHTLSAEVTATNTSETKTYEGSRLIAETFSVATTTLANPDGYTADNLAFLDLGTLAPGGAATQTWRFYLPEDKAFEVNFLLVEANQTLELTSAGPDAFANDRETSVTLKGAGFRAETAFFIQSTKLEVTDWSETEVTLTIPAGFAPADYGVMAVNPDGSRATLYPALSITQGATFPTLDPKTYHRSFVTGLVYDYATDLPLEGAKVSIPGLEALSDAEGFFFLRGVPPGKHAVKIERPGYVPLYRFVEVDTTVSSTQLKLAEMEPEDEAVTQIGPEGGVHRASNGAFLDVPEGALDQSVPIQFTHTRDALTLPELPEDGYYLAFAKLGPSGLTFKKPATLFLPLQDGVVVAPGTPIRISYFDEREKRWVQDITSGVITEIDGQLYLEYEINHFT